MITKIITGCNDCPFSFYTDYDPGYALCKLDIKRMIDTDKFNIIITPDWCPLKKQPIIVTYEP